MTHHPGNYIGRYSGIGRSTRDVVVAALREVADRQEKALGDPVGGSDWAGGYDMGARGAIDELRERADEIEDAGMPRWDCGARIDRPHVAGCSCLLPATDSTED